MGTKRRWLLGLGALSIVGCQAGQSAQPPTAPDGPARYRVQAICSPVPTAAPTEPPTPAPTPTPVEQRFTAPLSGAEEVPPRDTPATGTTRATYVINSTFLTVDLRVAGLRHVVAAHLHMGRPGENGPLVANLYGPAKPGGGLAPTRLSIAVLNAADLRGPLEGKPISDLATAMAQGRIYVNVHTNDGVEPVDTGPGDFPDGEVRGQVRVEASPGPTSGL